MKTFRYFIGVFLILIVCLSSAYSQNSSIRDLLKIVSSKEGEVVEVSGLVTQYVESSTKTTSYYLIKDEYGAMIKVNTSDIRITTNEKFKVNGILYFDNKTKEPFISEQYRILLRTGEKTITITPPPITWWEENKVLIIILGCASVVLIIILTLIFRKKPASTITEKETITHKESVSPGKNITSQVTEFYNINQQESFSTIKIPQSAPKTMKLIPGELEIMNGPDKGKKFKMAGNATPNGNVITIGRESQAGENAYSHIELKEKTVSRKQAELISKNGNLWIKNLSETNFTRADGKELKPGEQAELKNNSIINIGELELKYNT